MAFCQPNIFKNPDLPCEFVIRTPSYGVCELSASSKLGLSSLGSRSWGMAFEISIGAITEEADLIAYPTKVLRLFGRILAVRTLFGDLIAFHYASPVGGQTLKPT